MIKLDKHQIKELLHFYAGQTPLELQFALELQYAYKNENPFGKTNDTHVYADNAQNPNILLIAGSMWGVMLRGDAAYDECDDSLHGFIINQFNSLADEHKNVHINLCSPDWENKINRLFGKRVKDKIIRHNYRLNMSIFEKHPDWRKEIPAGFEMNYFDGNSTDFLGKHYDNSDFWSPESKRFGFALVKIDEKISDCICVYYENESFDSNVANVIEIGVGTKEEYRRQGYAFLSCMAFIEYCISNGLIPNWGCWNYKPESQALAKKLGFEEISQRNVIILKND